MTGQQTLDLTVTTVTPDHPHHARFEQTRTELVDRMSTNRLLLTDVVRYLWAGSPPTDGIWADMAARPFRFTITQTLVSTVASRLDWHTQTRPLRLQDLPARTRLAIDADMALLNDGIDTDTMTIPDVDVLVRVGQMADAAATDDCPHPFGGSARLRERFDEDIARGWGASIGWRALLPVPDWRHILGYGPDRPRPLSELRSAAAHIAYEDLPGGRTVDCARRDLHRQAATSRTC